MGRALDSVFDGGVRVLLATLLLAVPATAGPKRKALPKELAGFLERLTECQRIADAANANADSADAAKTDAKAAPDAGTSAKGSLEAQIEKLGCLKLEAEEKELRERYRTRPDYLKRIDETKSSAI